MCIRDRPHTAQDSIPFERMYKDGICRLANGRYSKCIEFEDINYQDVYKRQTMYYTQEQIDRANQADLVSFLQSQGEQPVSYTHLDVYKRQPLHI